jgi:hypothetical protein
MRETSQSLTDLIEEARTRNEVTVPKAQQLELFAPEEIVRPDYNIGKFATVLFASPYLKNLSDKRRVEWTIPVPEIEQGQALAAIVIRPLREQIVPTTTTFKVFMAVIQLWRMQGSQHNGTVYFSDRQLAEVAGWSWSGVIAKRIREHLDILQGTSIDWEFSFKKGESLERLVSKMHLLEEVTYLERRMTFKNETFTANHVARINATLVQNMLQNRVRPINFEALRQISSDASTRLYMMLDLYLAKKPKWARGSFKLLTVDLGYEGTRYNNRGERKRTLARLINDINGKELTNGKLALEMEETADGKDWKLVARKVKRIERKRPYVKTILPKGQAEHLADELLRQFDGLPKAGPPKRGFMVFLCERYPEHVLRDALARAKADYRGNVRKTVGAIFRYELELLIRARRDLTWYKAASEG